MLEKNFLEFTRPFYRENLEFYRHISITFHFFHSSIPRLIFKLVNGLTLFVDLIQLKQNEIDLLTGSQAVAFYFVLVVTLTVLFKRWHLCECALALGTAISKVTSGITSR